MWGAPTEILERSIVEEYDKPEQGLLNVGIDFRNIYSLWGSSVPSEMKSFGEEETTSLTSSIDGISQLWNENVYSKRKEKSDDSIEDYSIDPVSQRERVRLEWWDEVSEDGKELRLSQLLADEIYEEVVDDAAATPMTFERFVEETEMLIEQAEVERKETEAIMKAPPNAAFLDAVEDPPPTISSVIEEAVVLSPKFEQMILSLSEENGADDSIDELIDIDDILGGENSINSVSPISDAYQQIADVSRTILKDDI